MSRFYFNLTSKSATIPDAAERNGNFQGVVAPGKLIDPLDTLHDAYEHARKLIHKILFHVGYDDAEAWTVVILNDEHDAQMIVPFSVSHVFRDKRRKTG